MPAVDERPPGVSEALVEERHQAAVSSASVRVLQLFSREVRDGRVDELVDVAVERQRELVHA